MTIPIQFMCPPDLVKAIDAQAKAYNIERSAIIIDAIQEWLRLNDIVFLDGLEAIQRRPRSIHASERYGEAIRRSEIARAGLKAVYNAINPAAELVIPTNPVTEAKLTDEINNQG